MGFKFKHVIGVLSMLVLCSRVGAVRSANAAPFLASPVQIAVNEDSTVADVSAPEEALSIAERIEDADYKAIALAGIAQAYAEKREFERANEILDQSLDVLAQGSEAWRSRGLNRIAAGYFAIEEDERAVELLQQSLMSVGEIRSQTRNYYDLLEIVELYAAFGEGAWVQAGLVAATDFADGIDHWFRRGYALEKIAIAYSQLDDKAIAEAGITQIEQHLQAISASLPEQLQETRQISIRIAIAEAHARVGNTEDAIALLQPVVRGSMSHASLTKIAAVYTLLEDRSAARIALDELALRIEEIAVPESHMPENRIQENRQQKDRMDMVNAVAIAYADIGDVETARNFLEAAVPAPLALYPAGLDPEGTAIGVLSKLANTYARLGDIDTQQALLAQAFDRYVPDGLPASNQLGAWQAILFNLMTQNYAQISDDRAPAVRALLLQVAAENNWDYSFQTYLFALAQAERLRGEEALVQQRLATAIALLDNYDYGAAANTGLGSAIHTLTTLAVVYGNMPDGVVKREGLQALTQAADRLAYSGRQQRLLGAIAVAYSNADSCELIPTNLWSQSFSVSSVCR